jgi:hypothetical protein
MGYGYIHVHTVDLTINQVLWHASARTDDFSRKLRGIQPLFLLIQHYVWIPPLYPPSFSLDLYLLSIDSAQTEQRLGRFTLSFIITVVNLWTADVAGLESRNHTSETCPA